MSDAAAVDPEEALVAAASSCHMLFFLALCAARGYVVDRYEDAAIGTLSAGEDGKLAMTSIVLRPRIAFAGLAPAQADLDHLHHQSHERCYIANSLKTTITVEGNDV
jgi:organic hydroperoxide reductase OsmC/OhrA